MIHNEKKTKLMIVGFIVLIMFVGILILGVLENNQEEGVLSERK